jgi:CRISPR-associated exonuclease Cas4
VLEQEGVKATGEVLVPEERKREEVSLEEMRGELLEAIDAIGDLVEQPRPPAALWLRYCKTCAYAEFCWSGGNDED